MGGLAMGNENAMFKWRMASRYALAACLAGGCVLAGPLAKSQVTPSQRPDSNSRLLSAEDGRTIVDAARDQDETAQDCSHLVHQTYVNAGFEYPYASSFELYTGQENFERVRNPQPGDLIVWPGHVGIVLDPLEHSFYSLVSTGAEAQDYLGAYWRSRGKPRFYRYRLESSEILAASKAPEAPTYPHSSKQQETEAVVRERSTAAASSANRPPTAVTEKTRVANSSSTVPASPVEISAFEVPQSIVIAAGSKQPTASQVAEGISELSNASGSVLRTDDPSKLALPLVIYERLQVERLEIKRDHGWARLQIDSRATVAGGQTNYKRRHEKVRWELRRTESGWEAIMPADRAYVPNDVAVRHLAAQLARLAEGEVSEAQRASVMRQESHLASLLSGLLDDKAGVSSGSQKAAKSRQPAGDGENLQKPARSGGPS